MTEVPEGGLYRPRALTQRIVYVDGISRAGKSLISPVLGSLEGIEISRWENIFEYVGALHAMGKIDRFAAISLIRQQADEFLYNGYIGRNINFRRGDASSVLRNPGVLKHFTRLFRSYGDDAVSEILDKKPIFQNVTHEQMPFIDLHFDAWPTELRVLEIRRNPVDLIHSWWRRGWGIRFGVDPMDFTLCLRSGDKSVPYYARNWTREFLDMSPMDRIVRLIHELTFDGRKAYGALCTERKDRVFVLRFDDFITAPRDLLADISTFIDAPMTRQTTKAVKASRCPRPIDLNRREDMFRQIGAEASAASLGLIDELRAEIESDWT
ncbi:MAG TPA: hypothetical protein ENI79_06640 [Rhodospirillales bacterium]|nr:hypothetical protein [Rhodospirillales bacterium]